jgi:hypothetical protein
MTRLTSRIRSSWRLVAICVVVAAPGCAGPDKRLHDTATALSSINATTRAVGQAWTERNASTAYTLAALDQALRLTEAQRADLLHDAALQSGSTGMRLVAHAEQLEHSLIELTSAVKRSDGDRVRRELNRLSIAPAE